MQKALENYAFIDSQNLNLGVKEQSWALDFHRLEYKKQHPECNKAFGVFIRGLQKGRNLSLALPVVIRCHYLGELKKQTHPELSDENFCRQRMDEPN